MKKIALMSLIAVFAFIVLSSFIRLTNEYNEPNPLAGNKDFKNWAVGMTNLKSSIVRSNTQDEFAKFLKRTNTIVENEALAKKLGYKNSSALVLAFARINESRNSFIKATSALQTAQRKEIVKEALREEVPTCFDLYLLAEYNCWDLWVEPYQPNPNWDSYDWCIHIATLNYIWCMNTPPEEPLN